MTLKKFKEMYKPIMKGDNILVRDTIPKNVDRSKVWTLVDYEGSLMLVPEIRFVNRLGYVVTEKEWDGKSGGVNWG